MTARTNHPEFRRATALIDTAVRDLEAEAGDLASFATCLLVQAAAIYQLTHGVEGRDGSAEVMCLLAASHQGQEQHARQAAAQYGTSGRA